MTPAAAEAYAQVTPPNPTDPTQKEMWKKCTGSVFAPVDEIYCYFGTHV